MRATGEQVGQLIARGVAECRGENIRMIDSAGSPGAALTSGQAPVQRNGRPASGAEHMGARVAQLEHRPLHQKGSAT